MRKILLLACLVMGTIVACAKNTSLNEESIDLEALYQQIDEAINQSPIFVAEYRKQIAAYRDSLRMESSPEKQMKMAEQLFQLYRSYRNDSALFFAEQCINLAESLRRPNLAGRYRSLLAFQCSTSDMLTESLEQLRLVNRSALTNKELVDYYNAWMHVCGEMATLTQRKDKHQSYLAKQNLYRDSVMAVASEGSEEWLHLKMDILTAQRHFQDALNISDRWFRIAKERTHESAYAAFYRSMVFNHLGNHDQACYWLGKSALDDIRCAVMDQASLLFLAEHLAKDGDFDRALRYMDFTRKCNKTFSNHTRSYQYSSILNIIEKSHEATQDQVHQILFIAGAIIILLILALVFVLFIKRTK